MRIGPRVGVIALLMLGCGGEAAEERPNDEYQERTLGARQPTRIILDRAGPVLDEEAWETRRVQDLDNAQLKVLPSTRVDLSKEQLYSNEICGNKHCPAVDKPCEVRTIGPNILCFCEHEGYEFPCR